MSEIMRGMPFGQLMDWALKEYQNEGRVFGIQKEKFYKNETGGSFALFGRRLAGAVGPAAGPHAQLAQNIVAAYLCGARFVELKTVQKMDGAELRACVARPCINAEDEGYNVEWSTELTVAEAYDEYVKAYVAIRALAVEFGLSGGDDFAFNMSVGYDLEGIQTEKIDRYIEGMKDASGSAVYGGAIGWLRENVGRFARFGAEDIENIAPQVSDSVTLSTLHGCPPAEIERIANYLLTEKKLHTFIKCNPTLLGYDMARRLLDEMGYGYVAFDAHHFENDLQYADAVAMLGRLRAVAAERGRAFGVKLTNTFPVRIDRGQLPGDEMYMSGRALLPLSLQVAEKLAEDFEGALPISYSGGADAFNIEDIYKAGIRPITVATTLLKPGGYERLKQLAEQLEPLLGDAPAAVDGPALQALVQRVLQNRFYHKAQREVGSRKTAEPLGLFDCFLAPCRKGGCPIEQQIPAYLKLVSEERYDEAFSLIAVDNAAPSVTGTICDHGCQSKCTRMDYEEPVRIRNAKLLAAKAAQQGFIDALSPPPLATQKRAVVVGAGPAGIAAALFLRRAGMDVTVLEKRGEPFGIVRYVIPAFRIEQDALQRDFDMALAMGVNFRFGVEVQQLDELRAEYDYVVLAVGAWRECAPAVRQGQEHVLDALDFLQRSKEQGCQVELGRHVAVIGGGDVAMDCARAAVRAPGTERVTLVYRRTQEFMPATPEEIRLALADGVDIVPLRAPLRYDGATLCCEEMQLGEWEAGGRRGIVGTGTEHNLTFDAVICAVGARIDASLYEQAGIDVDGRGRPAVNRSGESSLENVYIAGDGRGGPATVVQAIADAKAAAKDICRKAGISDGFAPVAPEVVPQQELRARKGVMVAASDAPADGGRCLDCKTLCEVCCDVCPNRANVRVPLAGFADSAQILHLDALCNECGNCGVFCPHTGDPYKDKFTLFAREEDFEDSQNRGFLKVGADAYKIRLEDGRIYSGPLGDDALPPDLVTFIGAVERQFPYYMG